MVIYNSWLAKKLLKHPLGTMMLFGIILTKVSRETANVSPKMKAVLFRQNFHVEQFIECILLASPISLTLLLIFKWWLPILLMPTMFYIIYLIDYCIKYFWCYRKYYTLPVSIDTYAKAYVAFEMEAEEYEDEMFLGSSAPRETFGWLKYLFIIP